MPRFRRGEHLEIARSAGEAMRSHEVLSTNTTQVRAAILVLGEQLS